MRPSITPNDYTSTLPSSVYYKGEQIKIEKIDTVRQETRHSCGYEALGISRNAAAALIIQNSDKEEIAELLSSHIEGLLISNEEFRLFTLTLFNDWGLSIDSFQQNEIREQIAKSSETIKLFAEKEILGNQQEPADISVLRALAKIQKKQLNLWEIRNSELKTLNKHGETYAPSFIDPELDLNIVYQSGDGQAHFSLIKLPLNLYTNNSLQKELEFFSNKMKRETEQSKKIKTRELENWTEKVAIDSFSFTEKNITQQDVFFNNKKITIKETHLARDRDCGYSALNLTRQAALNLLERSLSKPEIVNGLIPLAQEALLTAEGVSALLPDLELQTQTYLISNPELAARYSSNPKVIRNFIQYEILQRTENNAIALADLRIVQLLALCQGKRLNLWKINPGTQALEPHSVWGTNSQNKLEKKSEETNIIYIEPTGHLRYPHYNLIELPESVYPTPTPTLLKVTTPSLKDNRSTLLASPKRTSTPPSSDAESIETEDSEFEEERDAAMDAMM